MTNLFWSDYLGSGYSISLLGYKLDQNDRPFGSAVPSGFGFITQHLTVGASACDDLNSSDPNCYTRKRASEISVYDLIPRAGSPYACSSDAASCQYLSGSTGSDVSVKDFQAPPWPGNETYDEGLARLKEIYKKIFNIYQWNTGNACNYTVCGPDPNGATSPSGGYFAGTDCAIADVADNGCVFDTTKTSCQTFSNVCVNSVFNDTAATSDLYSGCAVCYPYFDTEQRPSKRCMSDVIIGDDSVADDIDGDNNPLTGVPIDNRGNVDAAGDGDIDLNDCNAADFDLGIAGVQRCASFIALDGVTPYTCAQDTSMTGVKFRCYSPAHDGNDCKIPYNASTGSLLPSFLDCAENASGDMTCHYGDGPTKAWDTGMPCGSKDDCIKDDDNNDDTLTGELHALNRISFCADAVREGIQDFVSAGFDKFCVGKPFTRGDINGDGVDDNFFNEFPVSCAQGAVNALGFVLADTDVCNATGRCLPAQDVLDSNGDPVCLYEPEGYLPMCFQYNQNQCQNVLETRRIDTLTVTNLPLDETPLADRSFSPYVIPVVCDLSGATCSQVRLTREVNPLLDNAFSVNNMYSPGNIVEGFQNALVNLRFYMAADKNHMPVRFIDIDWGDGIRQSRVGYYKNHLQECGDPSALGPLTNPPEAQESAALEKACREGFRNQVHVYPFDPAFACKTCDMLGGGECGRDEDCPAGVSCSGPTNPSSGNASCYRPRVMIQDNWGWCTNGVYGEVGFGCFDTTVYKWCQGLTARGEPCQSDADCLAVDSCTIRRPPSPTTPNDAYVQFQGLIRVHKDPRP